MARGDHIYARRAVGYTHHGIDMGDGTVIHRSGGQGRGSSNYWSEIRRDLMVVFASGCPVRVRRYGAGYARDEVIARAFSRLGEAGFDLAFDNCEHFATWCATGEYSSTQVNAVAATAGVGVTTYSAAAGGMGVVSAAGKVVGRSGPGIMSGLASTGRYVGGGAVEGLVILGAVPALVSVALMQVALRDRPALTDHERAARQDGRRASVVGGAAGVFLGVGAVSTLGVPGLSAVGISSGLAAIGSAVGAGMAAGTIMVLVAPALLAALLGYGLYRLQLTNQPVGPIPLTTYGPHA